MTQLQKIVAKAKSLKKSYPNTKWTDLIKKASKLVTPAKKSVSGIKRTIVKKSAPTIPLIKKRIVSKSDFAMAGVKKKYTEKQLEKLADDYAYVTSGDLDRALFWLFDPEYTDTLIPKYEKAIKDYEKKHNVKISGIKRKKTVAKKKIGYKSDRIDQLKKTTPYIRKYKKEGFSRKDAIKNAMLDAGYMSGTKTHKDTKSHNVNIRVMSGIDVSSYLRELDAQIKNMNEWMEYIREIKRSNIPDKNKYIKVATKKIIDLKDYIRDLKSIIVKNTRKK
jgi:polyhydroxyalkanoate synthesis regulator phasin